MVNAETLGHLEELGSSLAFVEKLIRVFVADSAAILERIEKVLAARDYHEFRSLVHAMKGSSASMGTDRLTRTVRQPRQPVGRRAAPAGAGAAAHAERGARRRARAARALPAGKAQVGGLVSRR